MKTSKRMFTAAVGLAALAVAVVLPVSSRGADTDQPPAAANPDKPIKDTELKLRSAPVLDIEVVPLYGDAYKDPGENKLLPRAFDGAPPQIPHLIAGSVVAQDTNDCLDCHGPKKGDEGEPAISAGHYSDEAKTKLSGRRYVCLTCHVEQKDARPLVGNTFSGK
ncbi:MAG: nitrate reductase cytochrome c-type subunit [Candidatus Schekmanbacteria bacterium]|nr:nitrate reductase cytochrome c-type subunit [Candidatus Schekmanbacteria bacterium]